jgi:hypothetical protein
MTDTPNTPETKPISIIETIRKIVRKVREKEKYK